MLRCLSSPLLREKLLDWTHEKSIVKKGYNIEISFLLQTVPLIFEIKILKATFRLQGHENVLFFVQIWIIQCLSCIHNSFYIDHFCEQNFYVFKLI